MAALVNNVVFCNERSYRRKTPLMVGCETDEGLLIVHPEHETCDVCRNIVNTERSASA